MADNDIPSSIDGSKSFEEESSRNELSESQDGEVLEEGHDSEDDVDEEILLAKEMARIIAENPSLTPDELRDMQEKSKEQVAATVAEKKKKKKKGVKKIRSKLKAGVKAVTGRNRTSSASSGSTPGSSPMNSGISPKSFSKSALSLPNSGTSTTVGGVSVPPRVAQLVEHRNEIAGTVKAAGKGVVTGAANVVSSGAARAVGTDSARMSGSTAASVTDSSIRLTGILWKRRSGLGKYSTSAAWERRRVVLEGTKLLYYKSLEDSKNNHDSDENSLDEFSHELDVSGADASGATGSWLGGMRSSKVTARGHFDLLKEQATVAASYGHTGAPTPFALSIKVLGQTKWKLCYDTHEELMEWLAALTDIVIQGSVDAYNGLILEAYDPKNAGGGSSTAAAAMYGQLSEPPKNLSPQYTDSQEDVGGHRLWSTGHYNVRSLNYPDAALEEMESILEDVDSDEDEDEQVADAGRHLIGDRIIMNQSSSKEFWGIPAQHLFPAVVVLNLALCVSRASTVSADMFWHLITFTNIALLSVLSKVGVEAVVVSKSSDKKLMRRLSSGLGDTATSDKGDAARKSAAKIEKKQLAIPAPRDDFKPVAGSTTIQIENPTDLPMKDGIIFGGWRTADPTSMMIRSMGYKKHKKKCASPGDLYECIHLDIFESRTRYPDMASRVTLPTVTYKDDKGPKTWNSPDLFVISIAIPTDAPKLYGSADNGGGYTITMYYKMHEDTREILRRVTADGYNHDNAKVEGDENLNKVNAVRLLEEWCRRAPTDPTFMSRFKVVPNAQNLKEIGLPSWIAKYNGKPFLIKRPGETGFLYRHPEKSCIEFDISLHPFPYLAKQGICYMKDAFFKKVLVTFGFLIEGRSDDELPECLIGLFQLCYPDPQHAIQGEDFFAGTSPSSF
ncbi:MAG: hypothetical protein SGILL_007069 [Bacillariaceae sp.]